MLTGRQQRSELSHFEVIEMRGRTCGKYQRERREELTEMLGRFSQTVSLVSPSLKSFIGLECENI